jgi:hypothetical protein
MPWVPYDLDSIDNELPHQDPRPNKPSIPRRDTGTQSTEGRPSLLPTLRMEDTISFKYEPSSHVTEFRHNGQFED